MSDSFGPLSNPVPPKPLAGWDTDVSFPRSSNHTARLIPLHQAPESRVPEIGKLVFLGGGFRFLPENENSCHFCRCTFVFLFAASEACQGKKARFKTVCVSVSPGAGFKMPA